VTNVAVTNKDTEWSPGKEPAVTNVAVTNENSEWWPGKASYDQRGRWPLRRVECYGLDQLQGMGLVPHRLYGQLMRGL